MIRSRPNTELSTALELTPLIDIIFIVVVFLLLTANARLLSLPVDVPTSDSQTASTTMETSPLAISLHPQQPHYAIGQTTFNDWPDFKTALLTAMSQNKEQPLTIAADRHSTVEPLLKLLALLNEQQFPNTQILMEETQP